MEASHPAAQASYALSGRVIGAAVGVGAAVAKHCKEHGAKGLLLVDRNAEQGQAVASELDDESSCHAVFVAADLANVGDCQRVIEAISSAGFDDVHGLVNCAGITSRGALEDTTPELWDEVMNINVRAAFLLTQGFTEIMKKRRIHGNVVNISSVHAHGGGHKMLPYACSKAALVCLTKNAASELMPFGIRVNAINLGWTVTDTEDTLQQKTSGKDWIAQAEKTFPFGRLIRTADVSCAVGFLLSDASAMISGTAMDMHPEMVVGCLPRQFGNN